MATLTEATSMPTSFDVDSGRCGRETRITAEMDGKKIRITIKSTCPDVQKYAEALKEVDYRDIFKRVLENPIYVKASPILGPECLVPCAVVSATWTEAGMVSKSLLSKIGRQCIRFVADSP